MTRNPSHTPRGPQHLALIFKLLSPLIFSLSGCASSHTTPPPDDTAPFLLLLGTAQDAGAPQAGAHQHPGWTDPTKQRLAVCLAIIDPRSNQSWMIEATPDFRRQLYNLAQAAPGTTPPDAIFLTHAHIGHYTGLMFLGHESMGTHDLPVYAMPRMTTFLRSNGPWSQLVKYNNITLKPLTANQPIHLTDDISITPFLVPHRQEYAEVVGFTIRGPSTTALFIPDIDAWEQWDAQGKHIEDFLETADVAYLDGTFFANGEIPGRDMTGFPHPFITHTINRFAPLPSTERNKVRFIHLNHTNPAQFKGNARSTVENAGMHVAKELERFPL